MKKSLKMSIIGSLTGLMMLGAAFSSFAQSDGVIVYSDTFTPGETGTAYTVDDLEIPGTVCVFNNRNFTFSIDKEAIVEKWKNEDGYNVMVYDGVWIADVVEGKYLIPITKSPYEGYSEVEIKQVADGVYSLEGLELKENWVYAIIVEITSAPGEHYSLSGCEGSYFMFTGTGETNNTIPETTTDTSTSTDHSNNSSGGSGGVYYYWMHNEVGWWVQCSNGTYLTNQWYRSPESGLWYYMGADGYMLTNTVTPDGYTVNADGVWIQ